MHIAELDKYASVQDFLRDGILVDEKRIRTDADLRESLSALLNYSPGWIRALYQIRRVVMSLLSEKKDSVPDLDREVPFEVGEYTDMFDVIEVEPDVLWFGVSKEKHLDCGLAVVRRADGEKGFVFGTLVKTNNTLGRVYLKCIMPIHHLYFHAAMTKIVKR